MNPDYPIRSWWGCLLSYWRSMLRNFPTDFVLGMPPTSRFVYDSQMSGAGFTVPSVEYDDFNEVMTVFFETVEIMGIEVEAAFCSEEFALALTIFSFTDEWDDVPYCQVLHFSDI